MAEVLREAGRITYWKWHTAEGFYQLQTWFNTKELGHVGCYAVCLGNCFPSFRRKVPPYYSGSYVREFTHNRQI
jgi:hypothetical protein